ncbi:cation:proton antiporter [Amedibacillus sp. YH-ame6]
MNLLIIRLLLSILLAFFVGKLVSKIKLPAILGWLLTGMMVGPHALSIINTDLLQTSWYETLIHILECSVGLLIGTELVWKRIRVMGKQIIITTLTQSLGTFFFVSLVFAIVFYFTNIPLYLALIFGGIALATAPAPALSVVREFKTDGPVTKTLIPMAALDDMVGVIVFFTVISVVATRVSDQNIPIYMIVLTVLLPILIGILPGFIAGRLLKEDNNNTTSLTYLILTLLLCAGIGFVCNEYLMPKPVLNFMLMGMSFSTTFANMISGERLDQIMEAFNPFLGFSMIIVILNLGAPLDYHLIFGAGLFTAIYILSRGIGKYVGAYFGASITNSPTTVKKYLGFTLLPHSGVSLVFTGIAVSVLSVPAFESAQIVQGTIAAAAVINEVIAVIMAKKGFEWAGEFHAKETESYATNLCESTSS